MKRELKVLISCGKACERLAIARPIPMKRELKGGCHLRMSLAVCPIARPIPMKRELKDNASPSAIFYYSWEALIIYGRSQPFPIRGQDKV